MEIKRIIKNPKLYLFWLCIFAAVIGMFLYQNKDMLGKTEAQRHLRLMSYLSEQKKYADSYSEQVNRIVEQCQMQNTVSIFQKKNSFSYRNIEKTKLHYEKMQEVTVSKGNFKAFETVILFDFAQIGLFLCGFLIVWDFFEDEKKGLKGIHFATANGRGRLAWKRIAAIVAVCTGLTLLLYAILFAISLYLYGGLADWNCVVQSSPVFLHCTLQMKVYEYVIWWCLLHVGMTIVTTLISWAVLLLFRNHVLSLAVYLFLLGAEGALYFGISQHSLLSCVKYANVLSLILPGSSLYEYQNYLFANYPVNTLGTIYALLAILGILMALVCVGVSAYRYPQAEKSVLEHKILYVIKKLQNVYHQAISHLPLMGMEWYKVLIVHKGILFCAVWIFLLVSQMDTSEIYFLGNSSFMKEVYDNYSGPQIAPLRAYVHQKEVWLEREEKKIEIATEKYHKNLLSEDEYMEIQLRATKMNYVQNGVNKTKELLDYIARVKREQNLDLWIVNDSGYELLWTSKGKHAFKAVFELVVLILLLNSVFCYDKTCGIEPLIRSTGGGRGRLFWTKLRLVAYCCLMVLLVSGGFELYEVSRMYPLDCLQAPIQSLSFMEHFPIHCSIGVFFALLFAVRFLVLYAISMMICWCTMTLKGVKGLLLSLLLFVVPELLVFLGADWAAYFSVPQVLIFVERLQEKGFVYMMIATGIVLGLGIACFVRMAGKNGMRDVFGRYYKPCKGGAYAAN